jgi:hypothetical protein
VTPARLAEAERVERTYYWALNRLANSMAIDAKDLWAASVPPTPDGAQRAQRPYVAQLTSVLFSNRLRAQRLAIAYYRLQRGLTTDHTIAVDGETAGDTISLEELRVQFEDVLDEIEGVTTGDEEFVSGGTEAITPQAPPELQAVDEDADILIEAQDDLDLNALMDAADAAAEDEIRELAQKLGIDNFAKKFAAADKKREKSREAAKAKAFEDASNRQAAAAMRIMMNAARGLIYDLAGTDLRIKGWVRYSQTGKPCGFCAMLISRQVLYRTRATAQHKGENQEENKYHDNCKCTTVPIFDVAQFENSVLFNQNRYYARLWQTRINGKFSGDKALSEWRKLIRELNASDESESQTLTAA